QRWTPQLLPIANVLTGCFPRWGYNRRRHGLDRPIAARETNGKATSVGGQMKENQSGRKSWGNLKKPDFPNRLSSGTSPLSHRPGTNRADKRPAPLGNSYRWGKWCRRW